MFLLKTHYQANFLKEILHIQKRFYVEVSNFARVKCNNVILKQKEKDENKKGWLVIDNLEKLNNQYVYRLVAETFLVKPDDNESYHIHHINNNRYDNRPKNLIFLTEKQHSDVHGYSTKYK